MSKMETFHVETASRRSVRELVETFQQQQIQNNKKTEKTDETIQHMAKKMQEYDLIQQK